MMSGNRVGVGVVMAVTLIAVVSTVAARQTGSQTPNPAQKKYPYPVVRDLGATVPRGPRLMPSPPLGAGPWTYETTEAKKIRVSVVTRGFSHPYGFAFLPGALSPDVVASALRAWAEITRANAEDTAVLSGSSGAAYGARNLLALWPGVVELVREEPIRVVGAPADVDAESGDEAAPEENERGP